MSEEQGEYLGDLNKTAVLRELLQIPYEGRDEQWYETVMENVADASFMCKEEQVIEGPDGFPYFALYIPELGKQFQCYTIRHMIKDFLLEEGLGVAINPDTENPGWVFSYGDMVNHHLHDEFYTHSDLWVSKDEGNEVLKENDRVLVGQPSEAILPDEARDSLREFFASFNLDDVKFALVTKGVQEGKAQYLLVFNITPDLFEKEEYFQLVMRYASWFLPRHYTMMGIDEKEDGLSADLISL